LGEIQVGYSRTMLNLTEAGIVHLGLLLYSESCA
jgi:hypothetical protein